MQLKPITAIAVLLLVVVSLSVAGCTTTNTVTNQTTSPPTTSVNVTDQLNNAFTAQNFTILTPFTRSVNQYGNVVYKGVMKNGEGTLVPYIHNLTLEVTKDRNDSLKRADANIAQALGQGYVPSINTTGLWDGKISGTGDGSYPAKEVYVRIAQPNNPIIWDALTTTGVTAIYEPSYKVSVDYMTKA
jgi:hypothetical protein